MKNANLERRTRELKLTLFPFLTLSPLVAHFTLQKEENRNLDATLRRTNWTRLCDKETECESILDFSTNKRCRGFCVPTSYVVSFCAFSEMLSANRHMTVLFPPISRFSSLLSFSSSPSLFPFISISFPLFLVGLSLSFCRSRGRVLPRMRWGGRRGARGSSSEDQ